MFRGRILASTLVVLSLAQPAFAQEAAPQPATEVAAAAPAESNGAEQAPSPTGLAIPQVPSTDWFGGGNALKLSAGDFKNFFSADTGRMLAYSGIVAVAVAPWDREGVNNGFNLPTTVFQGGNLIGNFLFQIGAGMATYTGAKAAGNQKLAYAGRDIVRAQLLSQAMVQTVKHIVRRDRPDHSNDKSFPSGHAASMFASATVLQRYYGWKIGVPAYALGSYVALARMSWNRHHATDVVMGAGFGLASARTVTMNFGKAKYSVGVKPQSGGGASVNFTKIYK